MIPHWQWGQYLIQYHELASRSGGIWHLGECWRVDSLGIIVNQPSVASLVYSFDRYAAQYEAMMSVQHPHQEKIDKLHSLVYLVCAHGVFHFNPTMGFDTATISSNDDTFDLDRWRKNFKDKHTNLAKKMHFM
ncbi:uncharacterized protein EDB91DRAFT_1083735 [Suillus paluster]|uniref:uncharacterized protein n=1 Tax=Suillus paluster TaxID=48578 RepID=UPI001B8844E5|nr:uncharacterized protein EDB91DRAFT_1083735 [Suillus paluster]KAG1735279.1 hypothetical protein EDB91DRAFT_1083735 [Suillus paluster]